MTEFEGLGAKVKGHSNPRLMKVEITVKHDPDLIEAIAAMTDDDGVPEPVTASVQELQGHLSG